MLILSIASVSATNVSEISDNQDSNILNSYDSISGDSTSNLVYDNDVNDVNDNNDVSDDNDDNVDYLNSISSGSLGNSDASYALNSSIGSDGLGNSDASVAYDSSVESVSNDDESSISSIASSNSLGNSFEISSAGEKNYSLEEVNSSVKDNSQEVNSSVKDNSQEVNSIESVNSSTENKSVKTEKATTKIVNSGKSIVNGKTYYLSLKDSKGNALSGLTVKLTFNGKDYIKTTNSKGIVGLKIKGTVAKTYKMTYRFAGDENYASSTGSVNIKIKMATALADSGLSITKGKKFYVTLKNSKGKVLSGRNIVFSVNGKNYTKKTNSKGIASLKINLAANKTYNLTYRYAGSSYYGNSYKAVSLYVKTPTKFANSGSSIIKGKRYYITLKDSSGNVLANKKVKITYRGKTYIKTTNSKGKVSLKINSAAGKTYKLSYKYAGSSKYGASSGKISLKVKRITRLMAYSSSNITNGSAYKVVLKDSDGNVLKNRTIKFNFNGKNYAKKTNSKGIASLKINAKEEKTYNLSFKYSGSSYYASSYGIINLTVNKATEISNNGTNIKYSSVTKRGNTAQYKKGLNEIANLTEAQLNAYLKSSGKDSLNTAIKSLAKKLVSGKSTTWQKAQAIYNYVRDEISYSFYSNSKKGAKGTLSSKSANCCDQANLVVALCRAANIPARFSHGQGCTFSSGLVTGHVWAQIYVDGVWYSADATSSRNSLGNIKNWNVKSFYSLKQYTHLSF